MSGLSSLQGATATAGSMSPTLAARRSAAASAAFGLTVAAAISWMRAGSSTTSS